MSRTLMNVTQTTFAQMEPATIQLAHTFAPVMQDIQEPFAIKILMNAWHKMGDVVMKEHVSILLAHIVVIVCLDLLA